MAEHEKFKGHDYTEILNALGVPGSGRTDEELRQGLCGVFSSWLEIGSEEDKQRVVLMREFLKALVAEEGRIGYRAPLFRGLAQIEDAATFVRYFVVLLPHLWT